LIKKKVPNGTFEDIVLPAATLFVSPAEGQAGTIIASAIIVY